MYDLYDLYDLTSTELRLRRERCLAEEIAARAFTPAELARLRFVRWLVATGRLSG